MSEVIITENLGKKYIISHQAEAQYTALRDVIADGAKRLLRIKNQKIPKREDFWALRNVSFKINQGERVGIIGRNGAGKTTLLKLLSRITEPSEGRIKIKGRVASLLEVGTGFHPELTGRENIYLNGAVLGMTRSEIKKKFDDIVSFSGVKKFLDTPVKRYSSGMYVRLAFAVAAHLEPEILLVDEVLAVGDAEFQKKCLGKMEDISTKEGRTVLFVSHNMGAIKKLCKNCILINKGMIEEIGTSDQVIYTYQRSNNNNGQMFWKDEPNAPGDNEYIRIKSIKIINSKNEVTPNLFSEENFFIDIEYKILKSINTSQIGIKINTFDGEVVFQSGDIDLSTVNSFRREPGLYRNKCMIPGYLLNTGHYSISLFGHIPGIKMILNEDNILNFEVFHSHDIGGYGTQPGIIRPKLKWIIKKVK